MKRFDSSQPPASKGPTDGERRPPRFDVPPANWAVLSPVEPRRPGLRERLETRAFKAYYLWRLKRRWSALRAMGMRLGKRVNLPLTVWIDTSHCHLISIGDNCGFGDGCILLAHDAMANEFLDATRIAPVVIHDSCHFGSRTVILPGVEIGPRVIVGAGSVVTRSIPPDSVAAGNPARVIMSLQELIERRRAQVLASPVFRFEDMDLHSMNEKRRQEMREILEGRQGFVVGGIAATLAGHGHWITD